MDSKLTIVFLLFIGFSFFTCSSRKEEKEIEEIIHIKTAAVKTADVSIPVHTSGMLFPKEQIKLSFKTGGIIDRIHVGEQKAVKKGELLASLDLSEIEARVSQAENAFSKAERDLNRVENLYEDGVATLEQLQNVRTAYEVARSDLNIARFNLKHSKIYAPADGRILRQLVEAHEIISPGMPVFLFGATENQWVVKTGISEKYITKLNPGDSARVTFDAYPETVFNSRVSEISESIDTKSGTFEAEILVEEQKRKFFMGFIAKADIYPSKTERVSLIPIEALSEASGMTGYVYSIKNGRAHKIRVIIAHIFGDFAAVRSGLEGTDTVITDGVSYLYEGVAVKSAENK